MSKSRRKSGPRKRRPDAWLYACAVALRNSMRKHAGWWLLLVALIATVGVYSPGLKGSWLFDDYPNIVDNAGVHIQHLDIPDLARAALSSPSSAFKRPLASITFALNYLATGMDTYGWKATNLGIHIVNGLLIFWLAWLLLRLGLPGIRRGGAPPAPDTRHIGIVAAIIAGGWMLLPINLTAVLYIVQRMTSLANVFVLLGLIGYVIGRMHMRDPVHRRGRAFVLCVASLIVPTAIGFTAKETAVMLPLYAFVVEWVLFGFRRDAFACAPPAAVISAPLDVIPAKAGIHWRLWRGTKWIPAFAGMTRKGRAARTGTKEDSAGMTREHSAGMTRKEPAARTGAGFVRDAVKPRRDRLVIGMYVIVLAVPLILGLIWLLPGVLAPGTFARRDYTLGMRLLSEFRVVGDYITWTFVPTPDALSFYHDGYVASHGLLTPWTTLPSIIVLTALFVLAIWLRKRAPLAALGLLLFFGAQTLTGTILPLELVYEHRNYFASFGLLLAVIPILAARPQTSAGAGQARDTIRDKQPARAQTERPSRAQSVPKRAGLPLALPRYVLLIGLLVLWATQTGMTAYAWGDPLRLAETLAARAPDSPRAQYSLGRTYIILSHYDPASPFTRAAYAPLERAAALPQSSILPQQALIFFNARLHRPLKAAWWDSMIAKLKSRTPGVQDVSSLGALTQCTREGSCALPKNRMMEAFLAALKHPNPPPRLLSIYGDYAWNLLGDHALGERMLAEAVKLNPREPAYRITLTRMYVVQRQYDLAREQIQALERLNLGGRLNGSIAGLRALLPPSSLP